LFLYVKKFLAGQRLRCDQDTKARPAGLAERLGRELFRRRHTNAGPTITKIPQFTWRLSGVVVQYRHQQFGKKKIFK